MPRPVAKLLTPAQHADLMIAPRLHLELILRHTVDMHYLQSIAGVFNIVGVLAHMHRNAPLQDNIDAAQQVLLGLIEGKRPPTPDEANLLRQVFNQADRYIGLQNTIALAKAIRYSDREIAAGRTLLIAAAIESADGQ